MEKFNNNEIPTFDLNNSKKSQQTLERLVKSTQIFPIASLKKRKLLERENQIVKGIVSKDPENCLIFGEKTLISANLVKKIFKEVPFPESITYQNMGIIDACYTMGLYILAFKNGEILSFDENAEKYEFLINIDHIGWTGRNIRRHPGYPNLLIMNENYKRFVFFDLNTKSHFKFNTDVGYSNYSYCYDFAGIKKNRIVISATGYLLMVEFNLEEKSTKFLADKKIELSQNYTEEVITLASDYNNEYIFSHTRKFDAKPPSFKFLYIFDIKDNFFRIRLKLEFVKFEFKYLDNIDVTYLKNQYWVLRGVGYCQVKGESVNNLESIVIDKNKMKVLNFKVQDLNPVMIEGEEFSVFYSRKFVNFGGDLVGADETGGIFGVFLSEEGVID